MLRAPGRTVVLVAERSQENLATGGESEAARGPKLSATSSAWLIQEYLPDGGTDN